LIRESPQPGASQGTCLRLELACDLAQVRPVVAKVRAFLCRSGCTEKETADTHLALIEACTNAIKHAAENAKSQNVQIEARLGSAELELRVTDHTGGFRWPTEVSLPHPESEGGRGLFLIRCLMDTVDYLHLPEGNILILRKRRSASKVRNLP
jgi:serine/threonine-protein kinase RsbW